MCCSRDLGAALLAAVLAAVVPAACAQPAAAAGCAQAADAGRMPARGFAAAVARNAPALVTVLVLRPRRDGDDLEGPTLFPWLAWRRAALPLPAPRERPLERTYSSGFVLDAAGSVVTSAHAVHGADEVWVLLADGRRLPARVVGTDRRNDVALLQVRADGLTPVEADAHGTLCAGDWVAALGAPFGFESTVSAGVVSAWPRLLPGGSGVPLIQSDVAMNPGSSGGPLFNAEGRVVGMSSMIYSGTGIFLGVSFAVPIARVLDSAATLRTRGVMRPAGIGVRTQPLVPALAQAFGLDAPRGALVTSVRPAGPADRAGLRAGDVVLGVNGRPAATQAEVEDALAAQLPGRTARLEVWRDRGSRPLEVVVEEEGEPAATPGAAPRQPAARLGLQLSLVAAAAGKAPGLRVDSASGASLLAGLEEGDRIAAVNDIPVADPESFDAALARLGGRPVLALLVLRGGVPLYIAVVRQP